MKTAFENKLIIQKYFLALKEVFGKRLAEYDCVNMQSCFKRIVRFATGYEGEEKLYIIDTDNGNVYNQPGLENELFDEENFNKKLTNDIRFSFNNMEETEYYNLTFGEALELLKDGAKIQREGWNGKDMFLFMLEAGRIPKSAITDEALKKIAYKLEGDYFEALGSIRMFTADKKILTGWLASQTDLLAEDWRLYKG